MVQLGVLSRIVNLERAVLSVAQKWLPAAGDGAWVSLRLAQILPGYAVVVGIGDCDAESGVGPVAGVFGVVPECTEDAAGRQLEDVRIVEVVCVRGAAGYFSLVGPVRDEYEAINCRIRESYQASLLITVSMTLSPPLKATYVPRMLPSESLFALGYVPGPKTIDAPAIAGIAAALLTLACDSKGAAEDAVKRKAKAMAAREVGEKNIIGKL